MFCHRFGAILQALFKRYLIAKWRTGRTGGRISDMAQSQIEAEQLLGVRELLETALQCLDAADLHRIAVHVDLALNALRDVNPAVGASGQANHLVATEPLLLKKS